MFNLWRWQKFMTQIEMLNADKDATMNMYVLYLCIVISLKLKFQWSPKEAGSEKAAQEATVRQGADLKQTEINYVSMRERERQWEGERDTHTDTDTSRRYSKATATRRHKIISFHFTSFLFISFHFISFGCVSLFASVYKKNMLLFVLTRASFACATCACAVRGRDAYLLDTCAFVTLQENASIYLCLFLGIISINLPSANA